MPLAVGLAAIAACAGIVAISMWAHHAAYEECRAGGHSGLVCVLRLLL